MGMMLRRYHPQVERDEKPEPRKRKRRRTSPKPPKAKGSEHDEQQPEG